MLGQEVDETRQVLSPRRGSVLPLLQSITPKSGKVRVIPMVDEAGHQLARLAGPERMSADDDPVFASALGGHLDGGRPGAAFIRLRARHARPARAACGSATSPQTGSSTATVWSATPSDPPATTTSTAREESDCDRPLRPGRPGRGDRRRRSQPHRAARRRALGAALVRHPLPRSVHPRARQPAAPGASPRISAPRIARSAARSR
jgi:hypothetical protein